MRVKTIDAVNAFGRDAAQRGRFRSWLVEDTDEVVCEPVAKGGAAMTVEFSGRSAAYLSSSTCDSCVLMSENQGAGKCVQQGRHQADLSVLLVRDQDVWL